ncbi:hypothetical protein GOBAR_AA00206 [Gossypium barbadense]|uniref:Uncharacterized protein n=1 Tax=Gossypium barbadense TaxID=3634 RepID=A0A2P5YXP1_GOSBA|nr:hypothetical protein GOBAR_AA00206 [Gossypium barbadense]
MVSRDQGELILRVKDETITFQARNSGNTSEIEGDHLTHSTKTGNKVQPTLQEMSLKEVHEPFSINGSGPIHEERRLQIEELDEWWTHKPRTHDKPEQRQNKLNTFPHQLKVRDKVLLDAVVPHIVTTTSNEEIPLTVLGIFPFGTVEVSHPKFGTFKAFHRDTAKYTTMSSSHGKKAVVPASKKRKGASSSSSSTVEVRHPFLRFPIGPQEELFQILQARPLIAGRYIDWAAVEQVQLAEEFKEENDLHALNRHIHRSPSQCWDALVPNGATYNPSRSKALALPPSLRYLHAILTHTVTRRRESTDVVNTHNDYFLWCMSHGQVIDRAYFISLAIQHQTEQHRKGVISFGPYVTRLARYFWLLSTASQESSLTLIGQMSPQGISSMLSIRMIKKCQGTYPPQYRLAQSTEEEAYEDIPDDVLPQHEDPPSQPSPPSHPVPSYEPSSDEDVWRPTRTFLMMSFHSTRTPHLSHHHPLIQSHLTNHPAMKMFKNIYLLFYVLNFY